MTRSDEEERSHNDKSAKSTSLQGIEPTVRIMREALKPITHHMHVSLLLSGVRNKPDKYSTWSCSQRVRLLQWCEVLFRA